MATQPESANLKDGDRRTVTVVFADLSGFTGLSAQLDPEEVDSLMNGIFSRFEAIVRTHEGGVEKYIGDAMVAVFGYPLIHEDDAVRAINAALDFQDAVEAFSGRRAGPALRFRIGVHTGLITTGRRGEFEVVTGHTMNVAARVQADAPVGGILATRATLDDCGQEFLCSEPRQIHGKNLADSVEVCRILGRSRQYLEAEQPCIGQGELIDELLRAYTKHQGQSKAGCLVWGAAGIGKTAVVRAFVAQVRRLPDFRSPLLWARARRFRNRPFAVICDLIANAVETDPRAPAEQVKQALLRIPGMDQANAAAFVAFLAETIDYRGDSSRAFPLLATILRSLLDASRNSVWSPVIFIDNTDLADRQSLDFLSWYVRNNPSPPFLVLAERDLRQELLSHFPELRQFEVQALNASDSRRLLRSLLPDQPLSEATIELVLDRAGGVPLFIQSYARYLRGNANDLTGIPQTVQNLFLTTISNFNEDIRELLRKVSVFRYNFTLDDAIYIQSRTEGDPGIVEAALGFFEREDILWQEKGSWFFRHDLFKSALYDSLLNYNKKILHGLVVELMRQQESPHPVRLVYHLIRCGQYQAAIQTLRTTPEALANLDFLPLMNTLLEHLDPEDHDTRRGLSLSKAGLLLNNGMNEAADSLLKELLFQAFSDADLRCAAGAYHLLAHYNRQSFRYQKADFCGRKALSLFRQIPGSQAEQAEALANLCLNAASQGQGALAEAHLGQLANLAEAHAPLQELLLRTRTECALNRGAYREAAKVRPDWRCDWAQLRLSALLPLLNGLECCTGNNRVEQVQLQAALAIARAAAPGPGSWSDAMAQAEFLGIQVHNDFDRVQVCRILAEAWLWLGDAGRSEALALEGLSLGERHSTFSPSFQLSTLLAELCWRRGQAAKALFYWGEAQHIVSLGLPLDRRDRVIHHWLGEKLGVQAQGGQAALSLLDEELGEIDNPEGRAFLLKQRSFGEIGASLRSPETEHTLG